MPARLVLLALVAAGCSASEALRLDRADLVGTTWLEECPAPEIVEAFVRLDADGRLAWSYVAPDSARLDDVHTWAVEDGVLVLRWNEGGATSRYPAGPDPDRLAAEASTFCVDEMPALLRIR